jgi:hypothetical protein
VKNMTGHDGKSAAAGEPRWLSALAAFVVLGAFTCIWVPPIWPGRDVPMHSLAARVVSAAELFAPYLRPNVPLSGQAHGTIAGLLCLVLPISVHAASKVVATLGMLAMVFGLRSVARAVHGSASVAISAGAAMSVGWTFGMGFSSFALGLGVGWIALGLGLQTIRERELEHTATPAARVVLGVTALLAVWCHFVAAGLSYLVFILVWVQRRPRDARLLAPWAPGAVWAIFAAWSSLAARVDSGAVSETGTSFGDLSGLWQDVAGTAFVSFGGSVALGVGALLAVVALVATAGAAAKAQDGVARALARVSLGWWLLFLATPLHALGWHFARPRQIGMVVVLPLMLLPLLTPHRRAQQGVAATLCVLLSISVGANFAGTRVAASEVSAALESVTDDAQAGEVYLASALPLRQAGWGPHVQHTVGVAAYALLDGGVARHLFATNPAVHAMLYEERVVSEFPTVARTFHYQAPGCEADPRCVAAAPNRGDQLAEVALAWDALAFVGVDEPLAQRVVARGFVRSAPGLFRPRPASVTLVLERPEGVGAGPLIVRWGYETLGVVGSALAELRADGRLEVRAGPLLAGPVVLEVFFDNDGTGDPGPGDSLALGELRQTMTLEPGEEKRLELRARP